ncbi:MAG: hypothetical protein NZ903_00455 [Candidatus Micrarchaeota archaeon]|nr:hypothetical protein [Candidatus Micrarchaeota archaeon]
MQINRMLGENKRKSKKGFIFTILTLVIIVFMIIEMNIYFKTYELKLSTEPQKLRLQVMQDFVKAYSPSYFNDTAYIFVYNAMLKLNNDSILYPPSQSGLAELIWNITYTGKRTDRNVQLIDPANTLSAYDSNLSSLANSMNIEIRIEYDKFNITQIDFWTLQYNFTMYVSILDRESKTRVKFNSPISLNISIIGFEDPWLARMGFRNRNIIPVDRRIEEIRPSLIFNGTRGRGWFYGQPIVVTSCPSSDFEFSQSFIENKSKIMVTDNIDIVLECGHLFGAAIVVSDRAAQTNSFRGVDIPLFINPALSLNQIPNHPLLIISDSDTLITETNPNNYHYLLNVENLRSSISCGRYFARPNYNYGYLRRLTNNVTGVFDSYGIETFIFGTNQSIPRFRSTYSFIDREFNSSLSGDIYKGLPGCNNEILCNFNRDNANAVIPYPIRLSSTSAQFYLGIFNASMRR